jgi:hypothetical protein
MSSLPYHFPSKKFERRILQKSVDIQVKIYYYYASYTSVLLLAFDIKSVKFLDKMPFIYIFI